MTDLSERPWYASYRQAGIAPELAPLPYRNLAEMAHESCKRWQARAR